MWLWLSMRIELEPQSTSNLSLASPPAAAQLVCGLDALTPLLFGSAELLTGGVPQQI